MSSQTDVSTRKSGLLDRLERGPVLCAEGYLFECERRGYLQAGAFVPEVVLEHPEVVRQLHFDFVHAGSDVVQALTYYAHREKLRFIGKEDLLEPLNRQALMIAKQVAVDTGTLFAGNISNTNILRDDAESRAEVRGIFAEQLNWLTDAGADFIIGETFTAKEALLALEMMKETELPTVVTVAIHEHGTTRDGHSPEDACKQLEDGGADVVGLNCARGPRTMLPLLKPIVNSVNAYVAALPVPYRTHFAEPTMQLLRDPQFAERPFPSALDPFMCNRYEMADFARLAWGAGVRYLGACCGAGPHHIRSMAEALGKNPPGSRYSPDMSRHPVFGSDQYGRLDRQYPTPWQR
jgi:betaine-homocysteine S-methyltransferase